MSSDIPVKRIIRRELRKQNPDIPTTGLSIEVLRRDRDKRLIKGVASIDIGARFGFEMRGGYVIALELVN